MQDRACLARFFPVDRWGKRAPFLLTHCIIAACAASVVYMPPSAAAINESAGGRTSFFAATGVFYGSCGATTVFFPSGDGKYPCLASAS